MGGDAEGDLDLAIEDVRPIAEAGPAHISFIAHVKYEKEFTRSTAGCLVIPRKFDRAGRTIIRHDNPYVAFATLISLFRAAPPRPSAGVHPQAVVHPGARLGRDVAVEAGAVIAEGAEIGDRAIIGALSYVGEGAKVGE
ncbi:MAG: LpxD N-terminal domain-containing protein, partial [Polyangiaceae bacterium]